MTNRIELEKELAVLEARLEGKQDMLDLLTTIAAENLYATNLFTDMTIQVDDLNKFGWNNQIISGSFIPTQFNHTYTSISNNCTNTYWSDTGSAL